MLEFNQFLDLLLINIADFIFHRKIIEDPGYKYAFRDRHNCTR